MPQFFNKRTTIFLAATVVLILGIFVSIKVTRVTDLEPTTSEISYLVGTATFPDKTIIDLDVVNTDRAYQLGLGERDSLPENQGMLFVYPEPDILTFWMKGMRFPIDIIWLKDGEIIDISKNAQPESPPLKRYRPTEPVNQVIEVNAGFSELHGLKIGDWVDISW